MDVSRIQAYKPSVIDWKNLTAREILKYKSGGVEVPNLYYQWAISFLNEVENARNDDVTYESAKAQSRHNERNINGEIKNMPPKAEKIKENNEEVEDNSDDMTEEAANAYGSQQVMQNPKTDEELELQDKQKLTAKETRDKMAQDGFSKWAIAKTFKDISDENATLSSESSQLSQSIEQTSSSEIETLESDMNSVMAQIEEIKNEINTLINKKNDLTNISKIGRLNQELKSLGTNAQAQLASYTGDFESFDTILSDQNEIGNVSIDFGNETINIGNEIPVTPFFAGFRVSVVKSGEDAVANGNDANEAYLHANNINEQNISTANSYQEQIFANTGVAEISENDVKVKDDNKDPNQVDGKTKEADKDIKTSQNDGSDSSDKLHLNIDEILKRKIRKGEWINET